MTKTDTKKFLTNIGIGAVAAVVIFLIVLLLFHGKGWMFDYYLVATVVTGWVLAVPGAFLSLWLDKKKTGETWDGGLSVPGAWGSLALGIALVVILMDIVSMIV